MFRILRPSGWVLADCGCDSRNARKRKYISKLQRNTSANSREHIIKLQGDGNSKNSFQDYPYLMCAFTNWLDYKDIIKTIIFHCHSEQIYDTQDVKWVLRVIKIHREIAFPICSDNNSGKMEKQRQRLQTYYKTLKGDRNKI